MNYLGNHHDVLTDVLRAENPQLLWCRMDRLPLLLGTTPTTSSSRFWWMLLELKLPPTY